MNNERVIELLNQVIKEREVKLQDTRAEMYRLKDDVDTLRELVSGLGGTASDKTDDDGHTFGSYTGL